MTKYMFLFRGGNYEKLQQSPEEMQAHMQKWINWMQGLSKQGILVDGLPLGKEGKRVTDGGDVILDGPFAEGKEIIGGYLIVNANSLDEAVTISKGCPVLERETGQVEVREIMGMEM